jgi:hypothetical protein
VPCGIGAFAFGLLTFQIHPCLVQFGGNFLLGRKFLLQLVGATGGFGGGFLFELHAMIQFVAFRLQGRKLILQVFGLFRDFRQGCFQLVVDGLCGLELVAPCGIFALAFGLFRFQIRLHLFELGGGLPLRREFLTQVGAFLAQVDQLFFKAHVPLDRAGPICFQLFHSQLNGHLLFGGESFGVLTFCGLLFQIGGEPFQFRGGLLQTTLQLIGAAGCFGSSFLFVFHPLLKLVSLSAQGRQFFFKLADFLR